MRNPVITLLTDFGLKDPYVGSMKGVILRINPWCTLVDITHQVTPHDLKEGAFTLANAFSTFPKGTIHIAVVDPGVGSPRKPILLVTQSYFFIGPDNGIFTFVVKREKVKKAVALTNSKYFLPQVSTTFHGRDIFAPVAAHLSLGVKPRAFGHVMDSWTEFLFREPEKKEGRLIGEVFHIDTFGNLISNIDRRQLFQFSKRHPIMVRVGKRTIQGLRKGYWEGKKNEPIALIGSGDFLEISLREGNAQRLLKVGKGNRVLVQICK